MTAESNAAFTQIRIAISQMIEGFSYDLDVEAGLSRLAHSEDALDIIVVMGLTETKLTFFLHDCVKSIRLKRDFKPILQDCAESRSQLQEVIDAISLVQRRVLKLQFQENDGIRAAVSVRADEWDA